MFFNVFTKFEKARYVFAFNPPESTLSLVCLNSFAHLETDIFSPHSVSVRLDMRHLWAAVFMICCRLSVGSRAGLWLGHFKTRISFDLTTIPSQLRLCVQGVLYCWKVNRCSSLESVARSKRFHSRPVFSSSQLHLSSNLIQHDHAISRFHSRDSVFVVMWIAGFLPRLVGKIIIINCGPVWPKHLNLLHNHFKLYSSLLMLALVFTLFNKGQFCRVRDK